jgi:diguanylate cyclase (GGDEF)-like protein
MSDELLLWRSSTGAQIYSALLLALFFLYYRRATGRAELGDWTLAWCANGLALTAAWLYWLMAPGTPTLPLAVFIYLAGKTAFVVALLRGTALHAGFAAVRTRWLPLAAGVTLFALTGSLLAPGIDGIGVMQASLIALMFGLGTVLCWRRPGHGLEWLGIGLALRALLGAGEALAYGWRLWWPEESVPVVLDLLLASHSALDTGAEWVIALGCVLAVHHRIQGELAASHAELGRAHVAMTRIAERDALTGLLNRRMLPGCYEEAVARRGRLLFFDLDGFKRINDELGHEVGDDCLRRFARALEESFPEAIGLIRFAGDEFLALLPGGVDPAPRLAGLARTLAAPGVVPVRFSVGAASLEGEPELRVAVHEADLAMYADKAARRVSPP